MKNHTIAIVLAAWLLLLAAHAGFDPGAAPREAARAQEGEPVYQLGPVISARTFLSEDREAKELASYEYQLLELSVPNMERLSPEAFAAAERNVEAFNAKMDELLEELEAYGRDVGRDAEWAEREGWLIEAYYDEAAASGSVVGSVISVRVDRTGYTGGAHPNSFTSSCLFDLWTGQFIDFTQLADDPAFFRDGAAEKLIEKVEKDRKLKRGCWEDYQDIIRGWSAGNVLFNEAGMTVAYSPYELGPYAMGPVELRLDYSELAELLGPGGLSRLGVELPEAAE